MSTVIGIDPSITNTGFAILNNHWPRQVWNITCGKSSNDPLPYRLWSIQELVRQTLMDYCRGNDVCWLAVVEGPISPLALGNKGGKGFNNNIMATGVILAALEEMKIPTLIVAPNTRAKYATGKGNANKDTVFATVKQTFRLPEQVDHNGADALVLAYMAAELVYMHHSNTGFQTPFEPKEGFRTMPDKAYDQIDELYVEWRKQQ